MTQQSLVYALPSPQELSAGAESALELVEAFEVVDDATYQLAGEELNSCLRVLSGLNEKRMAITRPMDEAKARVMDLFRAPVASLERAAALWRGKMSKHTDAVRREVEAQRLSNERAAAAERDRLRAEAAELTAAGRAGEAEVKERVAEMVVATAPLVQDAPKVAGISQRKRLVVEVADLGALVAHIAGVEKLAHPELLGMLAPVSTVVRAHGVSLGVKCATPGLVVREETAIAGSRK